MSEPTAPRDADPEVALILEGLNIDAWVAVALERGVKSEAALHAFVRLGPDQEPQRARIVSRWTRAHALLASLSGEEQAALRALWRAQNAVADAQDDLRRAQRHAEPLRRLDPKDRALLSVELAPPPVGLNHGPGDEAVSTQTAPGALAEEPPAATDPAALPWSEVRP